MLELKLVKESLFVNALEAILDLVDVANVDCSSKGLELQALDTEHVAFIVLLFPAEDFQHYHCDEYLSMGIPIDDMVKAIRCADKDDTITITFDNYNYDTVITLSFESPNENTTTDYDVPLVNCQGFEILDWQDLESKCQALVKMPSAEFMHVCKYLSIIGDDGHISVTEKGLKFFASGKSGCVNINYMQPEASAIVVTMRAPISLILDLKYMNSLVKVSTHFNQVKFCLSTTQPRLMVECKIGQMGYIRYFLEPTVKPEIEEEEIKKRKSEEEKEGSKEIKGSREERKGSKRAKMKGSKRERDPKRKQRKETED